MQAIKDFPVVKQVDAGEYENNAEENPLKGLANFHFLLVYPPCPGFLH